MKIITVVGARPQFVKAAVVSRALRRRPGVQEILVHSGQHYDAQMSASFFEQLCIPKPDVNLDIHGGSHGRQTGRMLEKLEAVLIETQPDCVVVYGDTNTTLAGALAAAKLHIPIAHVEAGLRSFNRRMPEEINRVVTDHVSTYLFAPTQAAVDHLRHEGIEEKHIHFTGDVMLDAARFYADRAAVESCAIDDLKLEKGCYILATIHRASNTDDRETLTAILTGLATVHRDVAPVILPLHPRTRAAIDQFGLQSLADQLRLIEPVGYLDMTELERHAALIATDSGGVQKEAFFHRTPCVTLRRETEWIELLDIGVNRLADPADAEAIAREIAEFSAAGLPGDYPSVYGDGAAGEKIASLLVEGTLSSA